MLNLCPVATARGSVMILEQKAIFGRSLVQEVPIDKSRPVRAGEELDRARLFEYLQRHLPDLTAHLSIEQFPAGFSNLTYLLRTPDKELVLRRPPIGAKIKTAHDMGREFTILSHLFPVYPKVPKPVLFCEDETVLGAPFYVMERVKGIILRAKPPAGLDLSTNVMRGLSQAFIENLVEIHQLNYTAAGLADLGKPSGYVQRQVAGWTKRYMNARTDDFPAVERLAEWLHENQAADSVRASLIHNDYKFDNVVLAPDDLTKVVAILDWEMATIGNPLMDFGGTLGYWVDPDDPEVWKLHGFGLTSLPGSFNRMDLVAYYEKHTGVAIPNLVFYYAFGLLKIAVIVQQIYFRYRQGLTKDPRFAKLDSLIAACGEMAQKAIAKRRIDRLA
jgi:aminoglycoside phosphotransferase (APT) family kinase protein